MVVGGEGGNASIVAEIAQIRLAQGLWTYPSPMPPRIPACL